MKNRMYAFHTPVFLSSLYLFSLSDIFWIKRLEPIIIDVPIHPGVNTETRFILFSCPLVSLLLMPALSRSHTYTPTPTHWDREREIHRERERAKQSLYSCFTLLIFGSHCNLKVLTLLHLYLSWLRCGKFCVYVHVTELRQKINLSGKCSSTYQRCEIVWNVCLIWMATFPA